MRPANQVKKLGRQLSRYVEEGLYDRLVEEYFELQKKLLELSLEYDRTATNNKQQLVKTYHEIRDTAYYAALLDILEMLGWEEPIEKAKEMNLPEHVVIRRWAK